MSEIQCPHCSKSNPEGNAFCESCGKALPRSGGPRVLTAEDMPQSAAGQVLLEEQLRKQTKKVFTTLLIVGIIQLVVGGILLAVMQGTRAIAGNQVAVLMLVQFLVAGGFIGLAIWARKNPLPPAIIGLVLYATLVLINVVTTVSQMAEGGRRAGTGIGGIGIGWLDIIIMVVLAQGIKAGLQYRKLQQQA